MKPPLTVRSWAWLAAGALLGLLAACQRSSGGSTASAPPHASVGQAEIAAVPLGVPAGAAPSALGAAITNPYGNDAQAVQQGKELFIKMNCAGCHGYGAKGGMGPDLTDPYWRYGGTPVQIFKSIYEGRPQGMPAWNPALPSQDIWKLVAYIASLGGAIPASQYGAGIEGDRAGENVAQEAPKTLPAGASAPAATASATTPGTPPPPGTKP